MWAQLAQSDIDSVIVEEEPLELWILAVVTLVMVAGFIWFLIATRKRPGRRYPRKPPGQAEAGLDDWGGRG